MRTLTFSFSGGECRNPTLEEWKDDSLTPKMGTWESPRLLKLQNSIAGVKTPCIEAFFILLESYRSVNVKNGLAWTIWTFVAQVMTKRKAKSQIGNLTLNHQKSGIDSTPVCAGKMRHTVGKVSTRATTLFETSSRSEVCTGSYAFSKLQESQLLEFRDSHLGVLRQKAIWMWPSWRAAEYTIWGKVVASPESGPWWVLWIQSHLWLVLAPRVLQKVI
jgi:hypothetical protein